MVGCEYRGWVVRWNYFGFGTHIAGFGMCSIGTMRPIMNY